MKRTGRESTPVGSGRTHAALLLVQIAFASQAVEAKIAIETPAGTTIEQIAKVGAQGDQRHPVGVVEEPAADYQEVGDRPQYA